MMRRALPSTVRMRLRRFLTLFRTSVVAALGPNLVGIYLLGSVVSEAFQPRTSDIDFLVVTRRPLTRQEGRLIEAVHRRLSGADRWGRRLEGGYAARGRLRPWGVVGRLPSVAGGRVQLRARSDWTAENIMAVREQGITLAGLDPAAVLPAVDQRTLRRALDRYLQELARHRPTTTADAADVTLNVARCLYSMSIGRPSWRGEAARWLSQRVPATAPLLAAAMAVHRNGGTRAEQRLLRAALRELQQATWDLRYLTRRGSSER